MSHSALLGIKSEYLEISEYNFSWPGENGTYQDFGSVNYTMPSGKHEISIATNKITLTFIHSNRLLLNVLDALLTFLSLRHETGI